MKVIAAVEALSELLLNLKVTLNSGLLILCIFIFKHIIKWENCKKNNNKQQQQEQQQLKTKKRLTHHTSATKTMFLKFCYTLIFLKFCSYTYARHMSYPLPDLFR